MTYPSSRGIFFYIVFLFISSIISCQSPQKKITPQSILLNSVDTIVTSAVQKQAFPSCVVYAAHKGKPIFHKAYGFHTYDSLLKVTSSTIYDLASVTKVTEATLSLMKLYEEGKFDLDENIGSYVEGLSQPIAELKIRELLTHQSGLEPHLLFYELIKLDNSEKILSSVQMEEYDYRINDSLYAYKDVYPVLKTFINNAKVSEVKEYRYSDLFFYMVPEIVKSLSGLSFENYLYQNFYKKMDSKTLRFNAGQKFEDENIAPTVLDTLFRMELVDGTVHDEGAQLMRGVSGNAGLFSNAEDLAKI